MEELIEILINLIANWMQSGNRKPTPIKPAVPIQKSAPQKLRIEPSNRAIVTDKMPTARRAPQKTAAKVPARRAKQTVIAMAKPIMTGSSAAAPATPQAATPVKAVNAKQIAPASHSTKVPLSAASIKKWLNPATLQQQFMLTEIFKPPVSLRDPGEL